MSVKVKTKIVISKSYWKIAPNQGNLIKMNVRKADKNMAINTKDEENLKIFDKTIYKEIKS